MARSTPAAAPSGTEEEPLHFDDARAWEAWLKQNHASSSGVWLRLARLGRSGAGASSVTHPQALDVALCYGWVDARSKSESPTHWLRRFTPRSARSIWSQVNRDKVGELIVQGRMQPAGLAEIERAQHDGRWDAAYAPGSRAEVPADLQAALDANPAARASFARLDAKNRYAVLFRLHQAKRPETRERRLREFVAMLARGDKLHP